MFRNMKIEINEEQPLDEVVKELERLGYRVGFKTTGDQVKHIETYFDAIYDMYGFSDTSYNANLTELKRMEAQ